MNPGTYTKTEVKILKMLSDGLPHTRDELKTCMDDPLATNTNLKAHIHRLRGKLKMVGESIVCELCPGIRYRHVRLLYNPNEG